MHPTLPTIQPGAHVSVRPKAMSSMSSSSSLASGRPSNTSSDRMTWHVEQAHTPSHAPATPTRRAVRRLRRSVRVGGADAIHLLHARPDPEENWVPGAAPPVAITVAPP